MKIRLRKLNNHGFTHHAMLLGLVVIVGVAIVGSYQVVKSHADSLAVQTVSAHDHIQTGSYLDCPESKSTTTKCSTTVATVKVYCSKKYRPYLSSTNSCSETSCIAGFVSNQASGCVAAPAPAGVQTAARCKIKGFAYNKTAKTCASNCAVGFAKKPDGLCYDIDIVHSTMSLNLCTVLGRKWDTAQKQHCTTTCIPDDPSNTTDLQSYVKGKKYTNSYCISPQPSGTTSMSRLSASECSAKHRIFLDTVNACSARCDTGWHLVDGACHEISALEASGA